MKHWKYNIVNRANFGTEENPVWHESFFTKMISYTEANEEIAKREAYNGEYAMKSPKWLSSSSPIGISRETGS